MTNHFDEVAFFRLPWNNRGQPGISTFEHAQTMIQSKVGFLVVLTVAITTPILQQRRDFPFKIHLLPDKRQGLTPHQASNGKDVKKKD